jgi:hypothetical protein
VISRQRVDHTMCARCRVKFAPGDRVCVAMIVEKPDAIDPKTLQRAAQVAGEFEMVHASCEDHQLTGLRHRA